MDDSIKKRIKKKFEKEPKWAEDFSIETKDEQHVSRRDFVRYLSLVSFGLFSGTVGVLLKSFFDKSTKGSAIKSGVKLIDKTDMNIGESYAFKIPGTDYPGILVRLGEDDFVAYGQKCSHLQAPVMWKEKEHKFHCPCHKGAFSVETGDVLYGPPERALPKLKITLKKEAVYFDGLEKGRLI